MENKEIIIEEKEFEEPKMEVILFGEDIITTSGGWSDDKGYGSNPSQGTDDDI